MSCSGSLEAVVERLLERVRELESVVVQQKRVIAEQADRIVELQRRLGQDSSTSSRPPSSDAPWDKQPAKKRSSRSRSGRKPGKQPGSASRGLVDDPDETVEVAPDWYARCENSLHDAVETARVRRQVVDVDAPPPPPTGCCMSKRLCAMKRRGPSGGERTSPPGCRSSWVKLRAAVRREVARSEWSHRLEVV